MTKTLIFAGMMIGSYAGSAVPLLWGGSILSLSSVLLSGVGGILGIVVGYKVAKMID
jgi:hypothetical protein